MSADPRPGASDPGQALAVLMLLLSLQREARQAQTAEALRYHLVNQTRRLISYRQAAFVRLSASGAARLEAVSNIAVSEPDAPFARWMRRAAAAVAKGADGRRLHAVSPAALPEDVRREWAQWGTAQALWCPLPGPDGTVTAALWIARDEPWTPEELALLERLAEAYGYSWWALTDRSRGRWGFSRRAALGAGVAAALLVGTLAIPVPQSTLAPAEVAALEPVVVAAPLDGVIERFHVQPNQPVGAGQPLFSFEQTVLKNRVEVARRTLTSAEAELLTAAQGAFADAQSKARLAQLKAQVELRRAELDYARDLLDRVTVKAERAGIAVFADVNTWLGKPVTVGERVLELADPAAAELDIRVPVGEAVGLETGAEVRLFLNVDPLRPVAARVTHASYEAAPTAAGVLAYRVRAALEPGQPVPRIGLRGTAKVLGEPVPLALFLFRRPLALLRQTVGF